MLVCETEVTEPSETTLVFDELLRRSGFVVGVAVGVRVGEGEGKDVAFVFVILEVSIVVVVVAAASSMLDARSSILG